MTIVWEWTAEGANVYTHTGAWEWLGNELIDYYYYVANNQQ